MNPASAPIEHPVMEGLFNFVLVWSALFFGFLIDGNQKNNKGNKMLPYLIGMQFLTNAIYLPYLTTRDQLQTDDIAVSDLDSNVGENKLLPLLLSSIAVLSIYWGLEARADMFGDLSARWNSFVELTSSDRLSFAFVVDALYYSIFQGWLISDDCKRRNLNENSLIPNVGKYVPFFGLVFYLLQRPKINSRS